MTVSCGGLLIALTGLSLAGFWLLPGGGVLDLRRLAGGRMQPVLRPAYGSQTLSALLDAYGDMGRGWFGRMLRADLVFPMLYATAIWTLVAQHGAPRTHLAPRMAQAAGIAAAGFDELENMLLLRVLGAYPLRRLGLARLAGVMTLAKTICLVMAIGSLAVMNA
ncbi:hypothetical protein [Thiomonas intermedia]|uniref:hypothetical protein n=1 Tax=Thiomonas intermedia TaxID=926 RepID=UPI0009A480CC|nr:hypothetical protein [Thiomonas intermedia]